MTRIRSDWELSLLPMLMPCVRWKLPSHNADIMALPYSRLANTISRGKNAYTISGRHGLT